MDIGKQRRVIIVEPIEAPSQAPAREVEPQPVAEPLGEWPLPLEMEPEPAP